MIEFQQAAIEVLKEHQAGIKVRSGSDRLSVRVTGELRELQESGEELGSALAVMAGPHREFRIEVNAGGYDISVDIRALKDIYNRNYIPSES